MQGVFALLHPGLHWAAIAEQQAAFLAHIALAGECSAALMGLVASLLFQRRLLRPQDAASLGAYIMAFSSQFWVSAMLTDVDARLIAMSVQAIIFGAGQGSYLAGDLALAIKTMPDSNEASRYLGMRGLSAFTGGTLGALTFSMFMEVFGQVLPDALDILKPPGAAYHMYGYGAVLAGTFLCNVYVGVITMQVKTPENYENPQDLQDVGADDSQDLETHGAETLLRNLQQEELVLPMEQISDDELSDDAAEEAPAQDAQEPPTNPPTQNLEEELSDHGDEEFARALQEAMQELTEEMTQEHGPDEPVSDEDREVPDR